MSIDLFTTGAVTAAVAYSPVARVLVERACDATGAFFEPWRRRRLTRVDVEREVALALVGQVKDAGIAALVERAMVRTIVECAMRHANMEAVLEKATGYLDDGSANPAGIDADWLVNALDNSGLVSDEAMQDWWGRLVAGEANRPGAFSRQAVNAVANMDTGLVRSFESFCRFVGAYDDVEYPIILPNIDGGTTLDAIYTGHGIDIAAINRLHEVGLVRSLLPPLGFTLATHQATAKGAVTVSYSGSSRTLPCRDDYAIVGSADFTSVGRELSGITTRAPVPDFLDFIAGKLPGFTPHKAG